MKIIFFGTPSFAADVLKYLLENKIDVIAVVTKPDRPKGRSGQPIPTPVKTIALSQKPPIPVHQPEKASDSDFCQTLSTYQADLFVVVAYGEIIKQQLLDMPKLGCINVHASILPKYRGAAPIQWSIINGEVETGVTIMHMAKKMDAGDIIKIVKIPIHSDTTYGELEQSLCEIGKSALLKVITDFQKGIIHRTAQNHDEATYASKIELEGCQIDWNQSAETIHNLVRGTNPHPGAWCYVSVKDQKKRLKIFKTKVLPDISALSASLVPSKKSFLVIGCGQNALQLLEVQLEGKKMMTGEELLRGLPIDQLHFFKETS